MRVAIQMDPLARLNHATDTSLLLAREALSRGFHVWHYQPATLTLHHDRTLSATARRLHWQEEWQEGATEPLVLNEVDVVLMRQDPPFNMHYITATYLLEQLPARVRVLNNPAAVRSLPEKLFPLQFPEFLPPTVVSSNADNIRAFHREQKDIVLKPLYGHGGRGVLRVGPAGENLEALLEMLLAEGALPFIAQRFLPQVAAEDWRMVFIDGALVGAFQRIPQGVEIRANTRLGGHAAAATPGARQLALAEALGPVLRAQGLMIAGVDMIGNYLTEINITSPTGFNFLKSLYGTSPEAAFWDSALAKNPKKG